MEYYSLNQYLRDTFGEKIYKIALDGGFTCPNRDGLVGQKGCIFCSGFGSGDFATDRNKSITEQIEEGKKRVEAKMPEGNKKYIAYLQAFTNTYAPIDKLRGIYMEAISHPDIYGLSIATRPDCLGDEVIALIDEINHIKPVWVELGLQTIHPETAEYIRRGYELNIYDSAVSKLHAIGVHIVTHIILGLPGEDRTKMLESVKYVGDLSRRWSSNDVELDCDSEDTNMTKVSYNHQFGIKLQLLHVIRGTDLAADYEEGLFTTLTMEDYIEIVTESLALLPKDMVIHRITGDGDKKTLVAPLWSGDKKRVLNALNKSIMAR